MSWTGFANLDLSDVEPDDYAPLGQGEYPEVETTGAEIVTGKNEKDKRLVVTLSDVGGAGSIKTHFNLVHTGSKQAQEIGRKQLKSYLLACEHPNPDQPGDLATLKGLRCGIYVGLGKPFTGNDGTQRRNAEVKRFFKKGETAAKTGGGEASGSKSTGIDDDIPF